MNKKKVELQVLNISNSQAQAGAYAMVLGEINGPRQLPVIIGVAEAQSMMIEMRGITPPRPLTHTLFASVLKALGANLLRILIYKVENGIFYSYLYMKTEETILRIDECLKTEHSTIANENEDTDKEAASPKKTLEQLKAALQNAIDKEDYERAAQLRDIINQQKKQ